MWKEIKCRRITRRIGKQWLSLQGDAGGAGGGVFFSVVTEFLTSCDSEFLQFVHLLTVNVA